MSKSSRSSSSLLPGIFQTEKNKRFISSTIDQLIEPTVLDRLNAYVGQRYRPSYRTNDLFLDESSSDRQNYQLEPTVIYKTDGENIDFATTYIDTVNKIQADGGSTSSHASLWKQTHYSYQPPINIDKLSNYRQYYWLENDLPNITSRLGTPGSEVTFSVTNNAFGGYQFTHKSQSNPDIIVYKGNTYNFDINALGHPFHIKTKLGTGTDNQFEDYVTNNGTDNGTVTLKVPASDSSSQVETVLFYQCQYHAAMHGRIIIKDLADEKFDVTENIVGCKKYTDPTGLVFSNGMNISLLDDVEGTYANSTFHVTGVGEYITLTEKDNFVVYESFATTTGNLFDESGTAGFDTVGFDQTTGQSSKPDYWTISRGSRDLNAWSRSNRWVHADVIKTAADKNNVEIKLSEDIRAKRPIVEFVAGIELYNHGIDGQVVDVIDTSITDALSKIQGSLGFIADGTSLKKGDKVIFLNDPDVNNKVFTVDFVTIGDSTQLLQLYLIDDSTTLASGTSIVSKRGDTKGVTYHYDGSTWKASQSKTKIQQKPLFDIFDKEHVSLSDNSKYISSNFTGTTLFEVATDSQGTPDTVYGTTVLYDSVGLINNLKFNDTYNSESFSYVDNGVLQTQSIRQYHFHIRRPLDLKFSARNNWITCSISNPQKIIQLYQPQTDQVDFIVDHYNNAYQLSDLEIQVFVDGVRTSDYTTVTKGTKLFVRLSDPKNDSVISIKCFSTAGTPSGTGFFEVPLGLQRNPLNDNITSMTLGDIIKHYSLATDEHPDFVGTAIGSNNSRDISGLLSYGTLIMQHEGNDALASILARDEVLNLTKAIRFVGRSYDQIKNSIIQNANSVIDPGNTADYLDLILTKINQNKNSTMPFFASDMLQYSNDKNILEYTVVDGTIKNYPMSSAFNLNTLTSKAVYVYINNNQISFSQDYKFISADDSTAMDGINISASLSVGDKIKIVEYDNTNGNYIPPTPAKLGLAPKFVPEKFLDDSYVTTQNVIRGHDGSITIAYDDFRDDLLLEFEKRIYNNIKIEYDYNIEIDYGYFRNNEYTKAETNRVFAKDFYTWSGKNAVDYTTNEFYDKAEPFTYNWSQYRNSIDNKSLTGHWRAIYKEWYDTDTPHLTPWQMFGFSVKPDWWDTRYGEAPYTSGNALLWNDVENGFISQGTRAGYNKYYARPGVSTVIPVNEAGQLLAPDNAGIIGQSTILERKQGDNWLYGDEGPPETAWRRSSSYRYAEQCAKFLLKPSLYAGTMFDVSRVSTNAVGQKTYNNLYRTKISDYILPNGGNLTAGYINLIYDYLTHLGHTPTSYIANRFAHISTQLSYKLGGFSNKENLKVVLGAVSPASTNRSIFIPEENYNLLLYKSAPVKAINYSGVIVQNDSNGYKLSGYANFDRTFTYYKPKQFSDFDLIRIGATTESFTFWQPNTFYTAGSVVKEGNIFYRAASNITSGSQFSSNNWSEIGTVLPLKGGTSVKRYKNYDAVATKIPYGTKFNDAQSVADFLYGYDRYLQQEGFVFDGYTVELEQPTDWDLSVREFLFWSQQQWSDSAVITLSPAAQQIKFVLENTIGDDITDNEQYYSLLQQDGLPINPNDFTTKRDNGEFTISTNPDTDGIYNIEIRAVQKEHLLIVDNITRFSNVVFDEKLGNRQDRIKLIGFRTANWNGDYYSPGFVVDRAVVSTWTANNDYRIGDVVIHQTKYYTAIKTHTSGDNFDATFWKEKQQPVADLLPNWDNKAESFRDFYSLDTENFDADQQRYAQHLIGYQQRSYFDNLGLDELTQYKFYQGMIRDKGTISPIQKFVSAPQNNQTVSYELFEEYGFRVGDYGGHRTQIEHEFIINEQTHREQQLAYEVTSTTKNDEGSIINVSQTDLVKRPTVFSTVLFDTFTYNTTNTIDSIFKFPVAGYVPPGATNYAVFNEEDIVNLDNADFKEGSTVWIANTPKNDWDVRRLNSLGVFVKEYKSFDKKLQITTSEPHNLNTDDYIAIISVNDSVNGTYQVIEDDSTDNDRKFTVSFDKTLDSTNDIGDIFRWQTVRIDSMNQINTIEPAKGFNAGDYVYVDNDYKNGNGTWAIYQKQQKSQYERNTDDSFSQVLSANGEAGSDIIVNDTGTVAAIGVPGANKVFVYYRSSRDKSFTLRNEVGLDIGNTANDDLFGKNITATTDGDRIFSSAQATGDIVKLTLSTTPRIFVRGATITGATSGATGKILHADADLDVIYVKNTGITNFEEEDLDSGDSSSIVTVTKVQGSDATNQGTVCWINVDARINYAITQNILPPEVNNGGEFGFDLSVSGDGTWLIVGQPGGPTDSVGDDRGTVHVFKYAADGSSARYDHVQTLVPDSESQVGSRFGASVSISKDGNTIAVGSPKANNDSTTTDDGAVFIFRLIGNTFNEQEKLRPTSFDTEKFGTAIKLSEDGTDLFVGAPFYTGTLVDQGCVYHYRLNQNSFIGDGSTTSFTTDFDIDQSVKIGVVDGALNVVQNNDGSTVPYFIASGSRVIEFSAAPDSGNKITVSQYSIVEQLVSSNPQNSQNFGNNIEYNDDTLVVQAVQGDQKITTSFDLYLDDGSTIQQNDTTFDNESTRFVTTKLDVGQVFVFSKFEKNYAQEQSLTINDLQKGSRFGDAIAISGLELFVTASQQDTTFEQSGQIYSFNKANNNTGYALINSQPNVIEVDKINKSFVYNNKTKKLLTTMPIIDPSKGRLFPEVEKNIDFKTPYDPADYSSWGSKQLGQVWLNLSKLKFAWYEQGNIETRLRNWGKLHPSSVVEAKEWVQSKLTPTQWNVSSITNEGQSEGITGVAEDNFVTKRVFNATKGIFENVYFYWVTNPTVLPSTNNRTVSANQIAQSLVSPKSFSTNFAVVLNNNSIGISIDNNLLEAQDTIYHIENTTDKNQLSKHVEHVMIAKNDPSSVIPTKLSNKLFDSLIGFDKSGNPVPDPTLPESMKYGSLDRPRQGWFKNRINTLEVITKFINSKLLLRPYSTLKDFTKFNLIDPIPSLKLGEYDIEVDTELELDYINTESFLSGVKVLVLNDSTANNRWSLYTYLGTNKGYERTKTQTFDTTLFWKYIDWYASGYDSGTVPDIVVENEKDKNVAQYTPGQIVKVKSSYDGNFRIYLVGSTSLETIAIEKGTIELADSLYNYVDNQVGFGADAYDDNLFDEEAVEELRNILNGILDWSIDEDAVLFNELFFLATRIAQVEQKDIDWVFKSSFVKLINSYSSLEQLREYQINTTESVSEFLREILPFKSTVREEVTAYENIDTFAGDVTDFDNKSYYDKDNKQYVSPYVDYDDSTYFSVYNDNPWKLYSENYKYTIGKIVVDIPGVGYTEPPVVSITGGGGSGAQATAVLGNGEVTAIKLTNAGSGYITTPTVTLIGGGGSSVTTEAKAHAEIENKKVRTLDTQLKFDRTDTLHKISNATIKTWSQFTSYVTGDNIRYLDEIYRVTEPFTSGKTFDSDVTLSDSSSISSTAPLKVWTAADRIHAYYSPTAGMAGLIGDGSTTFNAYSQLMSGIEYKGVKVQGNTFFSSEGYDVAYYDQTLYDATADAPITNPAAIPNLDQILDSKTFTTDLGKRAEDVNVVGDAFISEYSAHAPDEVLPGGVYDTMDMKIFTKATDGASIIASKVYKGDGSTTIFATPDLGALDGLRVFVDNQYKKSGVDYTLDYGSKQIVFTTAPINKSLINIKSIRVSLDNLLGTFKFDGDGTTLVFNIPVVFSVITQSYILVDGVRNTTATLSANGKSTDITFTSAPASTSKIEIFVFDLPSGTKAFGEVITTQYNDFDDSTAIELDPRAFILGPHHHRVLVEGVAHDGTNRYKLNPPQVAYYTGDGSTFAFSVPDNPISSTLADETNIEVWKNGLLLDAGDYTVSFDISNKGVVNLATVPTAEDGIAVVFKLGHDYEVSGSGQLTLVGDWSDGSTLNNDTLFVTTFSNHDKMGLRTELFSGASGRFRGDTQDFGLITASVDLIVDRGDLGVVDTVSEDFGSIGEGIFSIDNPISTFTLAATPLNSDYTFVTINKEYILANHDYRLEGNKIFIPKRVLSLTDVISVTYVSATVTQPSIAYRIFKDIINRYHYRRISLTHSAKLSFDISKDTSIIEVTDGTVLPEPSPSTNTPGVVYINQERIAYFSKVGNVLSQITRGTLGTPIQNHSKFDFVVDASLVQDIPYTDTTTTVTKTGDGSTVNFDLGFVPSSKDQISVFVGGTRSFDFELGVDSSGAITFTTAPSDGVAIEIIRKTGTVWYDQGTSTAANGLGLQAATGVQVKFLQEHPTSLFLITN